MRILLISADSVTDITAGADVIIRAEDLTEATTTIEMLDVNACIKWEEKDDVFEFHEPEAFDGSPQRALRRVRTICRQLIWMIRQLMHGQK